MTFRGISLAMTAGFALAGFAPAAGPQSAGAPSCSDGSTPLQQHFSACYPPDCASLGALDWGIGGAPPGVIRVPKFDPADGELLSVELTYEARYVGSVCVDNPTNGCCLAAMEADFLSVAVPAASNDPPTTGFIPFQMDEVRVLTPAGFLLGSDDGVADCTGTPSGSPSAGDCTPGEDHYFDSWDEEFGIPMQEVSTPADLLPWIQSDGSSPDVAFDTIAIGSLVGQFCGGLTASFDSEARVWFEVTYTYCRPDTSYCYGDLGSGTPCPCGNDNVGRVPGSGCANGVFSSGARLSAYGDASIGADSLELRVTGAEPSNSGLFFQGRDRIAGGDGIVFGDGLLCAGGAIIRLEVCTSTALGSAQTSIPLGLAGEVSAGETTRYQYWYRASFGSPCSSGANGFNTSNGIELLWTP